MTSPTHKVHIFHVVRSAYEVEAEDHASAIEQAQTSQNDRDHPLDEETTDEVTGYLVDNLGDEDFENTRGYEPDGVSSWNLKLWSIRDTDDEGNDFSLFVKACDQDEAIEYWQGYYGLEGNPDLITEFKIPMTAGAIPW